MLIICIVKNIKAVKKLYVGITGATGGLGRRLTEFLSEKGFKIKCLVRECSLTCALKEISNVEIVCGDITNKKTLSEFVKDIDICFHIAALVSSKSKEKLFFTNVEGTKNLCESLSFYNPECRLIYCSSIVVKDYKFYKRFFVSDYTLSKYYAEKVVDSYKEKLKTTVIYPGYIFGKYDRSLINYMINMLDNGLEFFVKGGEKNAPIIHVDDLCELFYLSAVHKESIGKKYVSLEPSAEGMHFVFRRIGEQLQYKIPEKRHSKIVARIIMSYRKIKGSKENVLKLRGINLLSNHGKYFNNTSDTIGWTHKYNVCETVDYALENYLTNKGEL